VVGSLVNIAAGKAVWDRQAWGRMLYAVATPLMIISSIFALGSMAGPGVVSGFLFYTGFLYVLSRPQINDYFDGTLEGPPADARELSRYRKERGNQNDVSRVLGAICLCISTFLLLILLMMSAIMIGVGSSSLTAVSVLGIPFLIVLGLGIYLWGIDRWPVALGWVLLAGGILTTFTGLSGWFVPQTEMFQAMQTDIDPGMFGMFKLVALTGVIAAIVGGTMVRWMWEEDKRAVATAE